MPGRWAGVAHRLIWRAGAVRLWHRLHRLWTTLLSSASASALADAFAPAALAASFTSASITVSAFFSAPVAAAAIAATAVAAPTIATAPVAPSSSCTPSSVATTVAVAALLPARLASDQRPKHRLRNGNGRAARPHNWW